MDNEVRLGWLIDEKTQKMSSTVSNNNGGGGGNNNTKRAWKLRKLNTLTKPTLNSCEACFKILHFVAHQSWIDFGPKPVSSRSPSAAASVCLITTSSGRERETNTQTEIQQNLPLDCRFSTAEALSLIEVRKHSAKSAPRSPLFLFSQFLA